jgi:hypothetical protein
LGAGRIAVSRRLPAAAIPVLMGIIANLDRIEGTTF